MPTSCIGAITADFTVDCSKLPFAGLETVAKIINLDDLDKAASTFAPGSNITLNSIVLKAGKSAYKLEGFKKSNNAKFSLVKKENLNDSFSHSVMGTVFQMTPTVKEQLKNMTVGGRVVIIVENKYKGVTQEDAFEVYGFDAGMELSETSRELNANNGVTAIAFASVKDQEEPAPPYTYFDTDYATTKAAFDAL